MEDASAAILLFGLTNDPLDELSCFNAYRLLRHSSSPIYHIFCVQHLTIHDNQYTISSSLPLRLCLHRPSRSSLVRMDDCYFGHSLVHIQLDSLFWRVGAFHAETDSSDQQIIRNQPLLHPRVIHLAVMAGKSSNPGKRRKYRRYSILSHSHPPIPESIPTSPPSPATISPGSRGFGTPVHYDASTPASGLTPSSRGGNKHPFSHSIRSETPICDALVRRGTLPDRGPTIPWPKEPAFDQAGWRIPCEMNGIHDAMSLVRFKERLMRASEEADCAETLEENRSRARLTTSESKRARTNAPYITGD